MDFKKTIQEIKKASRQINASLEDKGFLDPEIGTLKFSTIDYKALYDFEIDKEQDTQDLKRQIVVNSASINNDKNIINVIYSLLRNLEELHDVKNSQVDEISSKSMNMNSLALENQQLAQKLKESQRQNHIIKTELAQQRRANTIVNKSSMDLQLTVNKLSNTIESMKQSHVTTARKLYNEIEQLKSKKQEKSTIIVNGAPVQPPSISSSSTLDSEVEKIMVDSSDLISNLAEANSRNLGLLKSILGYCREINDHLTVSGPLQRPRFETKDEDVFASLGGIQVLHVDLKTQFGELYDILVNDDGKKSRQISELEEELEKARKGWQSALDVLRQYERE